MLIRVLLIVMLSTFLYAQDESAKNIIGEVQILKGSAYLVDDKDVNLRELKVNDRVSLMDSISISKDSFLRLKMIDKSLLSFAGNSKVKVEKYLVETNKRSSILSLVRGKVRAEITKIEGENLKEEDSFYTIKTQSVSVGVRGTEFLVNSYSVAKKPVADTLLLSGKVNAKVVGTKAVNLVPGQAINTTEFVSSGKIRTISQKSLAKIVANKQAFMPNIQLPDGNFIELDKKLKEAKNVKPDATKTKTPGKEAAEAGSKTTSTGTSSTATSSATTTTTATTSATTAAATSGVTSSGGVSITPSAINSPSGVSLPSLPTSIPTPPVITPPSLPTLPSVKLPVPPIVPKKEVKKEEVIKYVSDSPWDIKDARTQRSDRKKLNECFYWVYEKKMFSDNTYERVREEKDCDEFEFEFDD